ncbi:MAG: LysE family transporter [Pseudomonadota bacterium]
MLNWELYAAFLPVMLAILMVPGPTLALIALTTAQRGHRAGLSTVFGVASGKACLAITVAALLSSAMMLVETHGEWLRWFGALFLLCAALRAWRSAVSGAQGDAGAASASYGAFGQGFVVAASSPITLLFLATQLPIFIDPALSAAPQMAVLAASYLVCALSVELTCVAAVAFSSRRRRPALLSSPKGGAFCLVCVAALVSPIGAGLGF